MTEQLLQDNQSNRGVGFDPCPISPVVDIVFSRWTTPILWALNRHGRMRFGEIRSRVGPITAKVLTQRLRQLERDGLVAREYFREVPPRVEYDITELGLSLIPAFSSLVAWADERLDDVDRARRRYDESGAPLPR